MNCCEHSWRVLLSALTLAALLLVFPGTTVAQDPGVEFRADGTKSPPFERQEKRKFGAPTPTNIASPRPDGWVVDETGSLSKEEFDHINEVCEEVNQVFKREMAVVVIDTTSGVKHRQFATDLFNHWRLGRAFRNQGVLLFAAIKDRRSEIILGKGIDSDEKVRNAQKIIMDQIVVPNFQDEPRRNFRVWL